MWNRFKVITGIIWDFVAPTVKVLLTEAGRMAMSSALAAVRIAAEKDNLTGREKFEWVFRVVQEDLLSKGRTLLTRHINKIIEMAYERFLAAEEKE